MIYFQGLKKPYNPILGETFRCFWLHPNGTRSHFVAEQVSHHPPVSAFYVSNREEGYVVNCSCLAKSKFYGEWCIWRCFWKNIIFGCLVACVASVSVGFPCRFRCFDRVKIKARLKKERGGGGEEKRKPLPLTPLSLFCSCLNFRAAETLKFARKPHGNAW